MVWVSSIEMFFPACLTPAVSSASALWPSLGYSPTSHEPSLGGLFFKPQGTAGLQAAWSS